MKKTIITIFLVSLAINIPVENVLAVDGSNSGNPLRKEIRNEVRDEIRNGLDAKISTIPGAMRRLFKNSKVAIEKGTLKSKNGTTLVITKDSNEYTILTDEKTQLRRKFWGKATLDEMQIGDQITVIGKWTDETQATIQAKMVKDQSIQKRNGVFFGTVKTLNGTGWVMETVNRKDQTVTIGTATKFINRKGIAIAQNEILVGHKVRVRGVWNTNLNTVTEITEVKDFSLPSSLNPTP